MNDRRRNAVGAEYDAFTHRDIGNIFDKNNPAFSKVIYNVSIVHDFMKNIKRRAVFFQSLFDNVKRKGYTGTKNPVF